MKEKTIDFLCFIGCVIVFGGIGVILAWRG